MLLQRLVEYAERDTAPAFHRRRRFDWQLNLDRDGRPESTTLQRLVDPDTRQEMGAAHLVPSAVKASGIAANLTADDAKYVLGWVDDPAKADRAALCHQEFTDLARRWAQSDSGREDPVAHAVWSFLRDGHAARIERPDWCSAQSLVLIAVAGVPAYRAPSVAPFWTCEVTRRKAGDPGLCLVCGRVGALLATFPGTVPKHLIPGATNESALVSVNEAVFGYDLRTQLAASPVCINCGDAVRQALVDLLGSPDSTALNNQDSRIVWWTTRPVEFDVMTMLNKPSPGEVATFLASAQLGRPSVVDDTQFCSVTVGGSSSRIMVRDWVDMPLGHITVNLEHWFLDHRIDPSNAGGSPYHGIWRLALASGRWMKDETNPRYGGRYADLGAKGADRPPDIHRDLVRAAFRDIPLPPSHLAHLVHRVRCDGHLDDTRASLIRLILTRGPSIKEKPMPGLDPTTRTPAYVAGRAFAVLEQLQRASTDERRNATYGDRYFSGAIANPRAALVAGRRDAIAWLRTLRRARAGAAIYYERELDSIFGLLDPASDVPARTTLTEQSLFLLGYHHQRAHHFTARATAVGELKETGQ